MCSSDSNLVIVIIFFRRYLQRNKTTTEEGGTWSTRKRKKKEKQTTIINHDMLPRLPPGVRWADQPTGTTQWTVPTARLIRPSYILGGHAQVGRHYRV